MKRWGALHSDGVRELLQDGGNLDDYMFHVELRGDTLTQNQRKTKARLILLLTMNVSYVVLPRNAGPEGVSSSA